MLERRIFWRICGVAFLIVLIALWQLEANWQLISPIYLPGPDKTFNALLAGIRSGVLIQRLLGTLERMFFGWLIASIVGVLIGSLVGISATARRYLQPTLEYLRPMPASAIIPVAIPILGLTDTMVLTVTAFAALWPTLLATVHGFSSVEPRLKEVAQILRIGRFEFVTKIALPNAMPDVIAGMRLSLTYTLILSVVGEMLSGRDGLGSWILFAARFYRAPDLFAGVLVLGLIGYVTAALLSRIEGRLLAWRTTN